MNANKHIVGRNIAIGSDPFVSAWSRAPTAQRSAWTHRMSEMPDNLIDLLAPSPWVTAAGGHALPAKRRDPSFPRPLYSAEERLRRDASPWTIVQGVLAPLQFVAFAVSLVLIARYFVTGEGYRLATDSILVKTALLYAIMITGSIWEKDVFGRWLFARAFFWEDVCSFLVLGLQTTYLFALFTGWGGPKGQMLIAVAAYAVYVVNATQFLLKLRAARLESVGAANLAGGHAA